MAYQIAWYIPDKVIYAHLTDEVSLEELNAYIDQIRQMMQAHPRFVHLISDARGLEKYPTSLATLQGMVSNLLGLEQIGWVVTLGIDDPLLNFISTTLAKIAQVRYKSVKSIEEAKQFLKTSDTTINFAQADESVLSA